MEEKENDGNSMAQWGIVVGGSEGELLEFGAIFDFLLCLIHAFFN